MEMTEEAQATQPSNENQENSTADLSAYFKDGETGVFDPEKVAGLARDLENQKKSTSYFQSQFMKKNGVPETAEGYYTNFKADSMYEAALQDEQLKGNIDGFFKWCKENNIGEREAHLFADFSLKGAVSGNLIDMRSQEQIDKESAEAKQKLFDEEFEKVKPMLDSMGRSLDENNEIIENFLSSRSIFTNDPEMKKYLTELADMDAKGYQLVTLLTQAVEHRGIPVVTGTVESKDRAALMKEYQEESDPVRRENIMKAYLGEN